MERKREHVHVTMWVDSDMCKNYVMPSHSVAEKGSLRMSACQELQESEGDMHASGVQRILQVKLTCIIEEGQESDASSDLSDDGLNLSRDLLV